MEWLGRHVRGARPIGLVSRDWSAIVLALLSVPGIGTNAWATGGGSNAIFSLSRSSPTALTYGYGGATLFVDDPGAGPGVPLTIALPPAGLGLTLGADVVALSSGRDDGIPAILAAVGVAANPMDLAVLRYQFSANQDATDGVTGAVTIPFAGPVLIAHDAPTFPDQFSGVDQAGDVLDNVATVPRYNFRQVEESSLRLLGAPANPLDNLDALESLGSFGVTALDADGDLRPDVPLFFAVDALSGGLPTSSVFRKPAGAGPSLAFATASDLGIAVGDAIDALAVWDQTPGGTAQDDPDGLFNVGDGIVFSLAEGSPSLPTTIGGVAIDEGGIFLALPGAGIVAALPGGYFSLAAGDELDAIHVVDPRTTVLPPCFGSGLPTIVRPFEGLSLLQNALDAEVGGPSVHVVVKLNETERFGDASGVGEYEVTATVEDPTVARIESAVPSWCGWEPGFPVGESRCEECSDTASGAATWTGPCPGATGSFRTWYIRGLQGTTPPLTGANLCLGDLHIQGLSAGTTRITLSATVAGWDGFGAVPKIVESADLWIRVSSTGTDVSRADVGLGSLAIRSPNPFRPNSEIAFSLTVGGPTRLIVLDVAGRRVRELASGNLEPGSHRTIWDGKDQSGRKLFGGVYLLVLETPSGRAVRKIAIIH